MSQENQTQTVQTENQPKTKREGTFMRVARYTTMRLVVLFFTVVVGVFLTILIANMGGYVDTIQRSNIREEVTQSAVLNPAIRMLPPEERNSWMEEQIAIREKRLGLDKPFMVRTTRFLTHALVLDLGRSAQMSSASGSRTVRLILLERLPSTLVLFATSNLLLFFSELFIALSLSRRYGSLWDKFFVAMAPTSAAPAWFYGIFLILIFAALLKILPFGNMVDAPPPSNPLDYALSLLKHMILPLLALTISGIFLSTYTWRTFFLIYSSEDYVDMAKAKGLTSRDIERRYVLRPTLPTIITTFALGLITVWTGAPILETVFNWPGLGRQLFYAVGLYDIPVIVGETVLFAYLLAITLFLLDFVYALVDPRVKVGGQGGSPA
jgi:peptide/nickel transport system permease protein